MELAPPSPPGDGMRLTGRVVVYGAELVLLAVAPDVVHDGQRREVRPYLPNLPDVPVGHVEFPVGDDEVQILNELKAEQRFDQVAASWHAVSSTVRPSGTIKPVASATGMNRPGDTSPRARSVQRSSAS